MRQRIGFVLAVMTAALLAACGGGGGATAPAGGGETPAGGATARVIATRAPAPTATVATAAPTGTAAGSPTVPTVAAGAPAAASPRATRAATPAAPPVAFGAAPWVPGEKTTYTIQDRTTNKQVGQATYTTGQEFEAGTLSVSITINQTQDAYQMGFDAKTFAPTSEVRAVKAPEGTLDLRAEFHQGGATIEATTASGTQTAQIHLPAVYYANDEFLLILRALPFKEGYRGSLVLVPSQGNPPTIAATVAVVGQETVATPLGPLRAWKVEATFENSSQTLWYGVDAPHYLVKYDDGQYVWLLTKAEKP
ncbi:MAG TPA: DUF3108 domain-containing protein [Thermomicrobiales bacterium]|nr:DUF3108 domain-containing protein [Thermomicrobiales bacterium]